MEKEGKVAILAVEKATNRPKNHFLKLIDLGVLSYCFFTAKYAGLFNLFDAGVLALYGLFGT